MRKPIEIIHDKQEYINEWKKRYKSIEKIAPIVNRIEEVANWEEQALSNIPEEAEDLPTNELVNDLEVEYNYLLKSIPLPPSPSLGYEFFTDTGGTISSASSTHKYIGRIGDYGTNQALSYSDKYINMYQNIQQSQNRQNDVKKLILNFGKSNLSQRFEDCLSSLSKVSLMLENKISTANFIRNFVNGLKGELFNKATHHEKENMTWEIMSSRLAIDNNCENTLIRQGTNISNILSRLADVLKDRQAGSLTNIDYIWTEVIDITYSILTSIKIEP